MEFIFLAQAERDKPLYMKSTYVPLSNKYFEWLELIIILEFSQEEN